MLSDHERRALALIEQGLAGDRRLAHAFGGSSAAGRRRWPVRALVGFGIVMLAVGLLVGGDGRLMLQGLLISGAGIVWSRWRAWRAAAAPAGGDPAQPSPPRSAGPPPEWFRPA